MIFRADEIIGFLCSTNKEESAAFTSINTI
jgi:hypothetical protein